MPYRQPTPAPIPGGPMPMGAPGGAPINAGRDAITAALMNVNNPAPGYLQPSGNAPPFGGIPGGAQPQAALGAAQPPMGPMGSIGGPATPGLNLPGVTQPGQLPQGMAPQNVLGGLGGMPRQQPQMPVPGRPY